MDKLETYMEKRFGVFVQNRIMDDSKKKNKKEKTIDCFSPSSLFGGTKEGKFTFSHWLLILCVCMCVCEQWLFGVVLFILSAADSCSIQPPRKWQLISIVIMRQGKGCRCQHKFVFFCFFSQLTWNSNLESVEKLCVFLIEFLLVHSSENTRKVTSIQYLMLSAVRDGNNALLYFCHKNDAKVR